MRRPVTSRLLAVVAALVALVAAGDVTFMVDDVDMSARWGWVPVLDFALGLCAIVNALNRDGAENEVFEFTESEATITFQRKGDMVDIKASYIPDAARISYVELQATSKRFATRLLNELVREHPEFLRKRLRRTSDQQHRSGRVINTSESNPNRTPGQPIHRRISHI